MCIARSAISFSINIFSVHFSSTIFCSLPIMPGDCRRVLRDREANTVPRKDRPIRNVVRRPGADISKYVHILDTVRWIEIAVAG